MNTEQLVASAISAVVLVQEGSLTAGYARRFNVRAARFIRYVGIYTFEEHENGFLPVNRGYKPFGIFGETLNHAVVDYAPFYHQSITHEEMGKFKAAVDLFGGRALFNDGCPPWAGARELKDYRRKLEALNSIVKERSI